MLCDGPQLCLWSVFASEYEEIHFLPKKIKKRTKKLLKKIPLYEYTMVCLSIYLLKDIFVFLINPNFSGSFSEMSNLVSVCPDLNSYIYFNHAI